MRAPSGEQKIAVTLGQSGYAVGELRFVQQGQRQHSVFAYRESWFEQENRFSISPDLPLAPGYFTRKASTPEDSIFHHAFADTGPDAWGRRVIARAYTDTGPY